MGDLKKSVLNGKEYKTGAVYSFNVSGSAWCPDILRSITQDGRFHGDSYSTDTPVCEIDYVGEITDAPIELEDGEWYMCDTEKTGGMCAKFVKGDKSMVDTWYNGDKLIRVDDGHIKPLYKMVKA